MADVAVRTNTASPAGGRRRSLVDAGGRDPLAGKASTPAQRKKHPVRVTAVQAARPRIPDDLSGLTDDQVAQLFSDEANHPDGPDEAVLHRLSDELGRRDAQELYGRARGDLTGMSDDEVLDLFTAVSRLDDPSEEILHLLSDDLDRRDREAAAADQRRREFVDRPVEQMTEEDLEVASGYASDLGDTAALERVMIEWDRRETERIDRERRLEQERQAAEAARLAEAKARAEAEARARADAEAEAWEMNAQVTLERERAAEKAKERASEKRWDHLDDRELMNAFYKAFTGGTSESVQLQRDIAFEQKRRKREQEAWEARQTEKQLRARAMSAPIRDLSDDELRAAPAALAGVPVGDSEERRTKEARIAALNAEIERRDQAAADRAARRAAGPSGPALVRNPLVALGELEYYQQGRGEDEFQARLRMAEARRRVFGLDADADNQALKAAEKADPRSAPEVAAMTLAWYRHLGQFEDLGQPAQWKTGPDDQDVTVMRSPLPPASVAKPAQVWQEVWNQARDDVEAGDMSTARRLFRAIARASGIPDSVGADDDRELQRQAQQAQRYDPRTDAQRAAAYLAEFRQLAAEQGVDPSDRLRHGPPDRPTSKRRAATHWRNPTPDEDRRIDAMVARGVDYLEALADVLGLDADALRSEQARTGGGGRASEGQIRKAYDEWVHVQWTKAEQETNGYLLSKVGQRSGADARSLFSGALTDTVRRRASEELLRWWADNPRLTYTQFKAQMTGGAKRARDLAAAGSAGRDFV